VEAVSGTLLEEVMSGDIGIGVLVILSCDLGLDGIDLIVFHPFLSAWLCLCLKEELERFLCLLLALAKETAWSFCNDNRILRMPREIGPDIGNCCVQDSPQGFSRIESHMGSQNSD
jgi:hypothetical protein